MASTKNAYNQQASTETTEVYGKQWKMSNDLNDKSIKNVPFSGKKVDYEKWSKRFLSYAQMKRVKKVLLGDELPPHHSEPMNPD